MAGFRSLCLIGCVSESQVWTAWEWGRPFLGLCHAPQGCLVSQPPCGSLFRPTDPSLPHSLWGSLDRLGCCDQKMRWVLHSLSLKVTCVCAQAIEIKEFRCLLHGHYCSVLQEIDEKSVSDGSQPSRNLGSHWREGEWGGEQTHMK